MSPLGDWEAPTEAPEEGCQELDWEGHLRTVEAVNVNPYGTYTTVIWEYVPHWGPRGYTIFHR